MEKREEEEEEEGGGGGGGGGGNWPNFLQEFQTATKISLQYPENMLKNSDGWLITLNRSQRITKIIS